MILCFLRKASGKFDSLYIASILQNPRVRSCIPIVPCLIASFTRAKGFRVSSGRLLESLTVSTEVAIHKTILTKPLV